MRISLLDKWDDRDPVAIIRATDPETLRRAVAHLTAGSLVPAIWMSGPDLTRKPVSLHPCSKTMRMQRIPVGPISAADARAAWTLLTGGAAKIQMMLDFLGGMRGFAGEAIYASTLLSDPLAPVPPRPEHVASFAERREARRVALREYEATRQRQLAQDRAARIAEVATAREANQRAAQQAALDERERQRWRLIYPAEAAPPIGAIVTIRGTHRQVSGWGPLFGGETVDTVFGRTITPMSRYVYTNPIDRSEK